MTALFFTMKNLNIRNIFNVEKLYRLLRIQCEDLLVLAEMEWNGMLFDSQGAMEEARRIEGILAEVSINFKEACGNHAVDINSGKHVSAVLYGGTIEETVRVVNGVYKSGQRKGEVKYSNTKISHSFDRLVEPLPNTETKRSIKNREEGKTNAPTEWSVKEDVVKELKARKDVKHIIALLLEYRRLYKLKSTYLEGWSNLIKEQCWEPNMIHGSLNQNVAVTGRLSSTQPNLQNADKETKTFLISRYKD